MNLLEAAYWKEATDKKILGVEKHSAYELMQSHQSFLLKMKSILDGLTKSRWTGHLKAIQSCRGGPRFPVSITAVLSPLCRLQNLRVMLVITTELYYDIYMVNVQSAFLNADVEEEGFIEIPLGNERSTKTGDPLVKKHKRNLDGHRQSLKTWFCRWTSPQVTSCFGRSSLTRACTFASMRSADALGRQFFLLRPNKLLLNKVEKQLMYRFKMTGMGPELSLNKPQEILLNEGNKEHVCCHRFRC